MVEIFYNPYTKLELPIDSVFQNLRKLDYRDFFKGEQLNELRGGQKNPSPPNVPTLPMSNLNARLLGKEIPKDTTRNTGTKHKHLQSPQNNNLYTNYTHSAPAISELNTGLQTLLHTTDGYPNHNFTGNELGFGEDNAMFANLLPRRAPTINIP